MPFGLKAKPGPLGPNSLFVVPCTLVVIAARDYC